MAVVTMKQLLESGVHFGHQTRRWNPKMKRFIFTERNGIYIIDLQQSLSYIDRAYEFVRETVAHGGSILFVGTKRQAQEAVSEQATRVGMPYVTQRWLGGMLTNFSTVHKRLQRLKELEEIDFDDVAASGMTKKELLVLQREKEKLEKTLGGIRDMARVPSAVWIVDTKKEHIAVGEARKLGIPVVAILDTNCDPDEVDYPIPGNDDAIRSVMLLTRVVADAAAEGLMARAGAGTTDEKPSGAELGGDEPLADWERELLAGQGAEEPVESERRGAGEPIEAERGGAPESLEAARAAAGTSAQAGPAGQDEAPAAAAAAGQDSRSTQPAEGSRQAPQGAPAAEGAEEPSVASAAESSAGTSAGSAADSAAGASAGSAAESAAGTSAGSAVESAETAAAQVAESDGAQTDGAQADGAQTDGAQTDGVLTETVAEADPAGASEVESVVGAGSESPSSSEDAGGSTSREDAGAS